MKKRHVAWVRLEKLRQRFVKPPLYQGDILPDFRQYFDLEMPGPQTVAPPFGQSFKRIEAVNWLVHLPGDMIDGMAGKNAKFKIQAGLVPNLFQSKGEDIQVGFNGIHLRQILLDVIDRICESPPLQFAADVMRINVFPPLKLKSDGPAKRRETSSDPRSQHGQKIRQRFSLSSRMLKKPMQFKIAQNQVLIIKKLQILVFQ